MKTDNMDEGTIKNLIHFKEENIRKYQKLIDKEQADIKKLKCIN